VAAVVAKGLLQHAQGKKLLVVTAAEVRALKGSRDVFVGYSVCAHGAPCVSACSARFVEI
jgi:hypothetical protein